MMNTDQEFTAFLDFEEPVAELEVKIKDLRHISDSVDLNVVEAISKLQAKSDGLLQQIYKKLTPWQKVLVARHQKRPHFLDYMTSLVQNFTPLSGDRLFADDHAIIGGIGRFRGRSCMFIGNEKGHSTKNRIKHNFGMASPEGYRKAIRLMQMAEQFGLPVFTFIDTAGAYPGREAEERGQSQAIARSIETCLSLHVPLISVVIGEGGSGGAIALATTDKVFMLEHSIYSVISPEGCASILWRSTDKARQAAEALRLTAQDAKKLGIIDDIIEEPLGGAHRYPDKAIQAVGDHIEKALYLLLNDDLVGLHARRQQKFMTIGEEASLA